MIFRNPVAKGTSSMFRSGSRIDGEVNSHKLNNRLGESINRKNLEVFGVGTRLLRLYSLMRLLVQQTHKSDSCIVRGILWSNQTRETYLTPLHSTTQLPFSRIRTPLKPYF